MPLIGNVFKPLAKSVLVPLGLTTVASATDAATHKIMSVSGCLSDLASRVAALIIPNQEMNDTMKTFKSLEEFGLLIKAVSKTIKN